MTHKDYENCWNAFVKSRPDTKSNSKPLLMPDLNLMFKIALRMWCWSKRINNHYKEKEKELRNSTEK